MLQGSKVRCQPVPLTIEESELHIGRGVVLRHQQEPAPQQVILPASARAINPDVQTIVQDVQVRWLSFAGDAEGERRCTVDRRQALNINVSRQSLDGLVKRHGRWLRRRCG